MDAESWDTVCPPNLARDSSEEPQRAWLVSISMAIAPQSGLVSDLSIISIIYIRKPLLISSFQEETLLAAYLPFDFRTAMDIIRDSTIGLIVRFVTRNRCLLYPEERPNFHIPSMETEKNGLQDATPESLVPDDSRPSNSTIGMNLSGMDIATQCPPRPLRRVPSQSTQPISNTNQQAVPSRRIDEELRLPEREKDIIVDWYGLLDPENPQNWSTFKKTVVTAILWLYTFTVYCASAIYTPSVEAVMEEHHVSHSVALLGLSLYVFGYGFGPLFFSPISEMSHVGRNTPYILTLILYVLLSVPTAMARSFPAFLVLRFLTGFLGSPCLATGGATLQDMYSSMKLPYGYTAWVGATFCAPALGPVISAFVVTNHTWRWSMWEVLWLALFTLLIMIIFFPETSSATILYRRARRTRQHFRDGRYRSRAEMDEAGSSLQEALVEALLRPLQITALDPAVFFTNLYSSYSYGVYYSFFEAFPIVYTDMYGFSLGLTGTAFISIVVACLVGTIIYLAYVYWYLVQLPRPHRLLFKDDVG